VRFYGHRKLGTVKRVTAASIAAITLIVSISAVQQELGKPAFAPHRGWYSWEIGDSSASIGPASWFLLLRISNGVVVKSRAEVQPT